MENGNTMVEENKDVISKETEQKTPKIHLETVGYNPRFPNQNQTKHCWAAYVEFHKCKADLENELKKLGKEIPEGDPPRCLKFKRTYYSFCPLDWIERWDTLVSEKRFPGQEIWLPELRRSKHQHH